MKWLSKFLRMRRRYGSVKLACLFFLAAFGFLVQGITSAAEYAGAVNRSVTYILASGSPAGVQQSDLARLRKLENVRVLSPQRLYSITCVCGAEETTLPVTEVYADYLQGAYGIHADSAGTCFYLNESAWKEIAGEEEAPDGTENQVSRLYRAGEEENRMARFVLESGLDHSSPMAYVAGNSVTLSESSSIRLLMEKTDITGKTLEKISAMGYSAENEQEIQEELRELETVMLKLKYHALLTGLSAALGYVLIQKQRLE